MIKFQLRAGLAALTVATIFFGSSASAQNSKNEVKDTGAEMMRRASELVNLRTCRSLNLAKKVVLGYQEIRRDHPGDLPDRSAAVEEISGLITQYCAVKTDSGQWVTIVTTTPIVTSGGGGVICTRCSEVPGAERPELLPKVLPTSDCPRCGELDVLTLALLHMDIDARRKFLETLPPNVQEGIKEVFTNKRATVTEVFQEISRPSIPTLDTPVFTVPAENQIPGIGPGPVDLKPGLGPGGPGTTILTPVRPDRP